MKGWKALPKLLLVVLLLVPTLALLPPTSGAVNPEVTVSLYMFRNPFRLETTIPTFSGDTVPGSLTPGESITYNLTYPLTTDLFITAPLDNGVRYVTLHLQDSNIRPGATGLKLLVELLAWRPSLGPLTLASTEFDQAEMANDDLKVPMISSEGYGLEKGTVLGLKLSLQGSGLLPAFFYTHLSASSSSHISFMADPIPKNGVSLLMKGPDGYAIEAIVPNGPEEVRKVTFVCSVMDAFGAYDVSNITLVVRSSGGNVLFSNRTDDPQPSGGQPAAFYNVTHVFPEGTPMGMYDVVVTGSSNTGQSVSITGQLEVRSGLFISLEEKELEAGSGDTVTFKMKVLNGGSSNDRVSFTGASDKGWTVNPPETIELKGGASATVEFRVVVPIRAALRSQSNITMGAASRNADRTYTESGRVTVTGVSTFGAELITEPSKVALAGQQVNFDVKVTNLLDETRSFELSPEDQPSSWSVSYSGSNGSSQGSLYTFTVGPQLDAVVRLSVVPSAQPPGRSEFKVYVRAQGEIDRKYLYLSLTVVDPSRDVLRLLGEATKTAVRKGTAFPVEFNKVFFSAELYNPTLEPLLMEVSLTSVVGWTAGTDLKSIELTPGSAATVNVTVTPEKGALHRDGAPYLYTLSAEAGAKGTSSLTLSVLIPAVHRTELVPESEVVDLKEGSTVKLNLTVRNKGNTEGKVELSATADPALTLSLEPRSGDISPGQTLTFVLEIRVGSLKDAKVYTVTIEQTFQGKKESVTVTVSAQPEGGKATVPWGTVLIAALILAAVFGAFILVLFIARKRSGRKRPEVAKGAPASQQVVVQPVKEEPVAKDGLDVKEAPTVGGTMPSTETTFEAVDVAVPIAKGSGAMTEPSKDEELLADSIANELLGGEPHLEEAEVLEAELLE